MSCGNASCSPAHTPAIFVPDFAWPARATQKVAFVCLHGSAKSLIAAAYFNGLARRHGLDFAATTSGPEPDAAVPPNVIEGLRNHAIDVGGYRPTMISAAGSRRRRSHRLVRLRRRHAARAGQAGRALGRMPRSERRLRDRMAVHHGARRAIVPAARTGNRRGRLLGAGPVMAAPCPWRSRNSSARTPFNASAHDRSNRYSVICRYVWPG